MAHACIKPGIYTSNDQQVILDLDITSMYPFLAITQGIYPKHLGQDFIDIYDKDIVSVRVNEKNKPKKEQDFVIVEGFKLAANGTNVPIEDRKTSIVWSKYGELCDENTVLTYTEYV